MKMPLKKMEISPLQRRPQKHASRITRKANDNAKRMLDEKIPEEKSEKRRELEKVTLTTKANQQQFDFQGQVVDIFEKAESMLRRTKYDEVANLLNQGKGICFTRMKIIMIADRDGWSTANAYQSDDLASDEEDEKRIQKAIKEAARKRKIREITSSNNNSNSSSQHNKQDPSHYTDNRPRQKLKIPIEELECWRCGKKGHFSATCTNPLKPTETLVSNSTDDNTSC